MRVVHAISTLDPRSGGTTTAVAGLAAAQAAVGLEVAVVATHSQDFQPAVADRLREQGVEVVMVGPARTPLQLHPQIDPVLNEQIGRADVVHVHALWEQVQHRAARLAVRCGVPYVLSPHGMLDPWSLGRRALKKRLYLAWRLRRDLDEAAALHFTTQTECDLVARMKLKSGVIVETLGLDLEEFGELPAPGTFRQRYATLRDRPMALFLSRLHYKKGLDLLVEAFARVADPQAMLVIAGPDADGYQAKIEALIAQHRLSDRVIFTGMLYGNDRIAALADADLFVLPSHQENFGIVVIEALAASTPVLISDQVNLHHVITQNRMGAVVPTKVEPLARELNRWLGDASLRDAVSQRARPFVWEHYDWKRIAERWKSHYNCFLR